MAELGGARVPFVQLIRSRRCFHVALPGPVDIAAQGQSRAVSELWVRCGETLCGHAGTPELAVDPVVEGGCCHRLLFLRLQLQAQLCSEVEGCPRLPSLAATPQSLFVACLLPLQSGLSPSCLWGPPHSLLMCPGAPLPWHLSTMVPVYLTPLPWHPAAMAPLSHDTPPLVAPP